MYLVAACIVLALTAVAMRLSAKPKPLEPKEVIRMQRFAEKAQREQLLPYE